jgi:RNA-binding protein
VLHLSPSRNLILKAETLPKIGIKVVDKNLDSVGSVFDVFGPVLSPYVAVKPEIANPQRLIKSMLYSIPSIRRKERRKHGR